jgi:hypothetical protein
LAQDGQQPGGPPGRVFAAKLEHLGPAGGRLGMRRGRGRMVVRVKRLRPAAAQAVQQAADGAGRDSVGHR